MLISFCTTCHDRLWQLTQTLEHNLSFTKSGEVELCIVTYNDPESCEYLNENYPQYISDGRLKILNWEEDRIFKDGSRWSCGYVKDIAHKMGTGKFLFNLDADNFIDDTLMESIENLPHGKFIITKQSDWKADGRSGRIGIPREYYGDIFYRDMGRGDDGDFITQCIGLGIRPVQVRCEITPIDNIR